MKTRLTAFLAMLTSLASATAATTPPKVVFIGDYVTYDWTNAFAAHSNWVNKGQSGGLDNGVGNSADILSRFQSDVISLHPAIVHIMMGGQDAASTDDANWDEFLLDFTPRLDEMVKEAQAANIKVVLGTTSEYEYGIGDFPMTQINTVIANYGVVHNIPVINYADALCICVESTGGSLTSDGNQYIAPSNKPYPYEGFIPSAAGYALMQQMAESAIETMGVTLKGGYLQNIEPLQHNSGPVLPTNVNTVASPTVVQFTPFGNYSDGSTHPLNNTDFSGRSGTWTTSSPLVMSINQSGYAVALTPGTSTIRYTPANGVKFSSWVMYVN